MFLVTDTVDDLWDNDILSIGKFMTDPTPNPLLW